MNLILRPLTFADEAAFFAGLKDWDVNNKDSLSWYTFTWKPGMSFTEMLQILADEHAGRGLAPGRVPHTMLYGFVGGEIVGRVSVRHELNDYLTKRGGNMGYAVAERFRRRGFAKEMVLQGLEFCRRELGLKKILITCADSNEPSWRIVENSGGKLENKLYDDEHGELIRRYWVQL